MATKQDTLKQELYPTIEKALASKEVQKKYKDNLDRYLARNTDKYFIIGPGERPIFSTNQADEYIQLCGLDRKTITTSLKSSKGVKSNWVIMNDPFNTANALATRYATIKKNVELVRLSQWYLLIAMYPSVHYKYFKHGTNDACMTYTINNLSGKFNIKQMKSVWNALTDLISTAYTLHKDRLVNGTDKDLVAYIQDVHTRINSMLKNIAVEYYENYKNQRFLETEYENFEEDSYHEADSNSYEIERIANNVVNHLVINGPDMKLVELSATTSGVSVNDLRTYTSGLVNSKHRDDIWVIVESILFLFLFNDDGESHSVQQIGTNDFMLYCLKIYKRSNTTNKNIVKIKDVLDKWVKELDLERKVGRTALLGYKKAFYVFFVLSTEKYGK